MWWQRGLEAILLLAVVSIVSSDDSIESLFQSMQTAFDTSYPSAHMMGTEGRRPVLTVQQMQNVHDKRCFLTDNSQAVEHFMRKISQGFTSEKVQTPLLAATPCLGSDSLGNMLGSYFENVACAHHTGMHFLSLAHIWEPSTQDRPSPFLEELPTKILHPKPQSDPKILRSQLKTLCRCPGSCHERHFALWTRSLNLLRPMFLKGIQRHLGTLSGAQNSTVVRSEDLSNVAAQTVLPLIPDAAVHYRCGDNFVGHYGFLPFRAFRENIPQNVSSIYVLAETRSRKTGHRPHLAAKCDAVFTALFSFLREHFPTATVVIRRGDDLYTDLARLTYARVTVCSVSTFCLWPAVAHTHPDSSARVYFPRTKLIVGGHTELDLGFTWLLEPSVVLGQVHASSPAQQLVRLLSTK